MAYPTHLAATLSGASPRQLAYWRRSDASEALFRPELGEGRRFLYSFRDVVALRTFVYMREQVPLQRIRKAVASLRDLGNTDHLSRYELVVAGDSIVLREPVGDRYVDLVEQPGAERMSVVMRDVWGPFTNLQGAEVVDLLRPRPLIEVDPEVVSGYPVIKGTRVGYDLVASLVADGVAPAKVGSIYPSVSAMAALDAVDFAGVVERYRRGHLHAAS